MNIRKNKIKHLGYSFGLFSGLGNTFMSPTTTNDGIDQEYDALVLSNGIAAILAVNNISLGLTVGVDHLLDSNSNIWIYQGKPWIGFALGLNLN